VGVTAGVGARGAGGQLINHPLRQALDQGLDLMLVVGTDTYVGLSDLIDRALALGHAGYLEAVDEPTLEEHARMATIYLDHAWRWRGTRAAVSQPLAWPRAGVVVDGVVLPSDTVPSAILTAQVLLCVAQQWGGLVHTGGADPASRTILREAAADAAVVYSGSKPRSFPMVGALLRDLATASLMGPFRQASAARGLGRHLLERDDVAGLLDRPFGIAELGRENVHVLPREQRKETAPAGLHARDLAHVRRPNPSSHPP
jgi:hypothetical protein